MCHEQLERMSTLGSYTIVSKKEISAHDDSLVVAEIISLY